MPNPITPAQRDTLLQTLEARFARTMPYHPDMRWQAVEQALQAAPGQAYVAVSRWKKRAANPTSWPTRSGRTGSCSSIARRKAPKAGEACAMIRKPLLRRKQNAPADSALHMAQTMGAELLSEAQYRALQQLGDFDRKTSSWILTPADIRALGGALFCDKRYGHVFTYHNGADSYYAAAASGLSLAL